MRRLAVIGQPVSHSRSPGMHNAALAAMGLADAWRYEAIEAGPESFEELVRGMPGEGFAGANVTVPHKGAALALADELSGEAREIGAANTLVFSGDRIRAENTDAPGLIAALPGSPEGRSALVLGAGGAARAVVWALVREGAEVSVWNRTALRAKNLCEDLGAVPLESPRPNEFDVLVNATSIGLGGEDPFELLPLAPEDFHPGQAVVDLVYGEEPSAVNRAAAAAGATSVDGIEVLVRQGAIALALWTGADPPLDVMRAAAREG